MVLAPDTRSLVPRPGRRPVQDVRLHERRPGHRPRPDGRANLGFEDAKFMLVSWSAFVNRLLATAARANITLRKVVGS